MKVYSLSFYNYNFFSKDSMFNLLGNGLYNYTNLIKIVY